VASEDEPRRPALDLLEAVEADEGARALDAERG
jgi:hypothetical protein